MNGEASRNTTTNNATNRGGDVHVHIGSINPVGKLSTADIANFTEETCRHLEKGLRNGTPYALAALRRRT